MLKKILILFRGLVEGERRGFENGMEDDWDEKLYVV